jgi:glycerol uptake facilitator-like aquaporin
LRSKLLFLRLLSRRLAAEALGTGLLLAAIVGSGIMGEKLAGGNVAIALLANTMATGAMLVTLIFTFGPISGAHFNPAVTLAIASQRGIGWGDVPFYILAKVLGALLGVGAAHLMFAEAVLQVSEHAREGSAQLFSEFVATFGLLCVIWGCARLRSEAVPVAVGLYITGAYWFTASTSFANPAVTLARAFTNTFPGIRPIDAPGFIVAQIFGALTATVLFRWLVPAPRSPLSHKSHHSWRDLHHKRQPSKIHSRQFFARLTLFTPVIGPQCPTSGPPRQVCGRGDR